MTIRSNVVGNIFFRAVLLVYSSCPDHPITTVVTPIIVNLDRAARHSTYWLDPDLYITLQMFLLFTQCERLCVSLYLHMCERERETVRADVSICPAVGIQVLQAPAAITDLGLLMLFISSRPFASSCSTLPSNIPHTPLELRERPVARQGTG